MDQELINAVFQSKPSKQEAKADITTRIARGILDSETSAREAKSERLRAARLAQETTAKTTAKPAKKIHRAR